MAVGMSPVVAAVERHSIIACPACAHRAREEMPTDACVFFHTCAGCGTRLRPLPGDCCVFCSYGTVPCPPKQAGVSTSDSTCDPA